MRTIAVGDNVVDIYVNRKIMYLGGNALNFSAFSSKLGNQSSFIGVFGNDELSRYSKDTLRKLMINFSRCKTIDGENGYSKVRIVNGDRKFITSNRGGVLKQGLRLNNEDINFINSREIVHFNINGNADKYLNKIDGPKIVYDFSDLFKYEDIKRIGPQITLGCFSVSDLDDEGIKDLIDYSYSHGLDNILCTMGSRGSLLFTDGKIYKQDALKANAVDTMGAGDSFITAFSTEFFKSKYNDKDDLNDALYNAAKFAANQVERDGSFGYGESINVK